MGAVVLVTVAVMVGVRVKVEVGEGESVQVAGSVRSEIVEISAVDCWFSVPAHAVIKSSKIRNNFSFCSDLKCSIIN